jgi:hypothetical protein
LSSKETIHRASKIYSLKQHYLLTIMIYVNVYKVFVLTSQRKQLASIKKTVNIFWRNGFRAVGIVGIQSCLDLKIVSDFWGNLSASLYTDQNVQYFIFPSTYYFSYFISFTAVPYNHAIFPQICQATL